jgi:hypothetical protein
MIFAQIALAILLLAVCSFAPGFFLLRRLSWRPMEKLCASIGLSLILVYLASWAIFCAGVNQTIASAAVSVVCCAMALACRRDIQRLVRIPSVRKALLGWVFLFGWTMVGLGIIRVYSGGSWQGDWEEHFQRSLFFLHRFPVDTKIFGGYTLPARPPMMNVLASFFMAHAQDRFELFQVVFAFLNLLVFLPCWLLMPLVAPRGKRSILPLVLLFAAGPAIMQNLAYTWSKAFAAFYVLLAIWLYAAAIRRRDIVRAMSAFLALAAGLLVHYSAGPYILFLSIHFSVFLFWKIKGRKRWLSLATGLAACLLILATWFGWSIRTYGLRATLTSNTSVNPNGVQYTGNPVEKVVMNVVDSLVPRWVFDPHSGVVFTRLTPGVTRDYTFTVYQQNLIFAMGCLGGPLVLWLTWIALRNSPQRKFWAALLAAVVTLGIAVVGERGPYGSAHLTLLPIVALGITLLAANFTRRRLFAAVLLAGCVVDFSFGVFLHYQIQHRENSEEGVLFPDPVYIDGAMRFPLTDASRYESLNWLMKHQQETRTRWLPLAPKDHLQEPAVQQFAASLEGVRGLDQSLWGGWYSRHNGRMTFLGDDVATPSAAELDAISWLLLALFGALLLVTIKGAFPAGVPVSAIAVPSRATTRYSPGPKRSSKGRARRDPDGARRRG